MSLDRRVVDHSMNIVVRTGRLDRSRTGGSHRLIGIGRRDICKVPLPSGVGFITGNGLLRGGNRHPVAADPRIIDARHPYFGRVDDRLAEGGRYGGQSVEWRRWLG